MNRRRTNKQREADRAETARRALERERQEDIARHLGVSQSQVSRDLDTVKELWAEDARRDFARLRARELARLTHLEAVSWEAWERSKKPKEVTHVRHQSGSGACDLTRALTNTREGSPRHLPPQVLDCLQKRRRLLRLGAPARDASLANDEFLLELIREADLLRGVSGAALLRELDHRLGGIRVWLGLRAPPGVWTGTHRIFPPEKDPQPREAPPVKREES